MNFIGFFFISFCFAGAPWKIMEFLHVKPGKVSTVRNKEDTFDSCSILTIRRNDSLSASAL